MFIAIAIATAVHRAESFSFGIVKAYKMTSTEVMLRNASSCGSLESMRMLSRNKQDGRGVLVQTTPIDIVLRTAFRSHKWRFTIFFEKRNLLLSGEMAAFKLPDFNNKALDGASIFFCIVRDNYP